MVTLAVLGDGREELVRSMGKRYSLSDIALYEVNRGYKLTLVDPVGYPDSLKALATALGLADAVLVCVPPSGLNALSGEQILTTSLLGLQGVLVYTGLESTSPHVLEQVRERTQKVLAGTSLEHAPGVYVSTTTHEGMGELWGTVDALCSAIEERYALLVDEPTRVIVDQAFNVRGVGCVALGVVRAGGVSVRDRLTVYPMGQEVEVRSIQVHDEDVKSAPAGSRVGLALKGIQPNKLERGMVVSSTEELTEHPRLECELVPFTDGVSQGDVVHVFAGLQSAPLRIEHIESEGEAREHVGAGERCTLSGRLNAKGPLIYRRGDVALLANLDAKGPRMVARARIMG